MPRPKKERGRPLSHRYPPRIDATAEEIVGAMLSLPPNHEWQYEKGQAPEYRCATCEKVVHYPDTLYRDGRCKTCHSPAGSK